MQKNTLAGIVSVIAAIAGGIAEMLSALAPGESITIGLIISAIAGAFGLKQSEEQKKVSK